MISSPLDRRLAEIVSAWGFQAEPRRGLFTKRSEANTSSLYFSRGKQTDSEWTSMSPSIGIVSGSLSRLVPVASGPILPEDGVQHWFRAAEFIHDEYLGDDWYELSETDSATWIRAERDLVGRILPTIDEHMPDSGLRDCWSRFEDPFIPPAEQTAYLVILTADIGPESMHRQASQRLHDLLNEHGKSLVGYERIAPFLSRLPWSEGHGEAPARGST